MTENQEKQIMRLLTKAVNGVQRLEDNVKDIKSDVAELKGDVAELKGDVAELKGDVAELKGGVVELKGGQARMEKQMEIIGRSLDSLAGDNIKVKARVGILEERVN